MNKAEIWSAMRHIRNINYKNMFVKACVEIDNKIFYLNALEIRSLQELIALSPDIKDKITIYNGPLKGPYQKRTETIVINNDGSLKKNIDFLLGNEYIVVAKPVLLEISEM